MFDKTQMLQAFIQLMFGMLGAFIVQFIFMPSYQKMVTVDITGLVKSFENEILQQKLTSNELTQKVTRFSEALNSTLMTYSSNGHFILIPKEVVISGAPDKTDELKELIKKRMSA